MEFDDFDKLRESPKDRALAVEVQGLTLPWLSDGLALERAKDRGHSLGDILSELEVLDDLREAQEDADEADFAALADQFTGVYSAAGRLLWLGFLRFEPDIEYEDALGLVGPGTLSEIPLGQMLDNLFPEEDDEVGKGAEETSES